MPRNLKFLFEFVTVMTIVFSIMALIYIENTNAQGLDGNRLAGKDRYETAVAISQKGWHKSYFAVLVNGQDFGDAIGAAPLAKKFGAPVLLTKKNQLPEKTLSELKRLETKHLIIIGGTEAIDIALEGAIKQAGIERIERIFGQDRYETSLKIAEKIEAESEIILVSGQSPWDALAVNAIGAYKEIPILLTEKNHLPPVTKHYLEQKKFTKIYIIGGSGAITPELEKDLSGVVRIGGKDRYDTNQLILEAFCSELDFNKIYVVTGGGISKSGFADALTVGPLAGKWGYPVILTKDTLSRDMEAYLQTKLGIGSNFIMVGGESLTGEDVRIALKNSLNLLNKTVIDTPGTYGPTHETQTIAGNVVITVDGVTLKNTIIEGDLLLTQGIGQGEINLQNVTVKGATSIYGGGPNSIILYNFNCQKVTVEVPDGHRIRLVAQGSTRIDRVTMNSNGSLEEERLDGQGFTEISIPAGKDITLRGQFERVDVNTSGSNIYFPQGSLVNILNMNAAASITGQGQIAMANIQSPGTSFQHHPFNIQMNEGISTQVSGRIQTRNITSEQRESRQYSRQEGGGEDSPTPVCTAIHIASPNTIPAHQEVMLTAIGAALAADSWADILSEIKANTGGGENWITGVEAASLTLEINVDGTSAVLQNQNDNEATITADFRIPAAKIRDKAGNICSEDIIIDSYLKESRIINVNAVSSNGFYKTGATILIHVTFDEEVIIEAMPTLQIETGMVDRLAYYVGGSGTNQLSFEYIVQPGDSSTNLDYTGVDALNGKIMVKGEPAEASLTLPPPGADGSLGHAKDIVIDTLAPTAIHISSQNKIPSNMQVVLTAVEGPLSNASWTRILNRIKANTINGEWVRGISALNLTITPAVDGASATLNNNASTQAVIVNDFVIPADEVVDQAGNIAVDDIIIDAFRI